MPSTVCTRRPAQARPNTKQDSTGMPSTSTVQVPHSPSSQPCFVPVRPRSSRSTSSRVLCGAEPSSAGSPFSLSAIFALVSGMVPSRNLDKRAGRRQLSGPNWSHGAHLREATEGRNDGRGMWGLVLVLLTLSVLPSFRRLAAQSDTNRARAVAILPTVPLIDGHNDIPDAIRERGGLDSVDVAVSQPKLMTDIPKLRAGAVGGQFWAADVPVTTIDSGPHPAVYALEQIEIGRAHV